MYIRNFTNIFKRGYFLKYLLRKKVNFLRIIEDLVSIPEAASILKLDRSRIGKLCRQGRFEGARKIGERWVIPRESVKNFVRLPPGTKSHAQQDKETVINALNEAEIWKRGYNS